MQPHPTLDQFQVFLTVVEKGSFSAASRALNRTQSVISYTIANLEAQLGVALFCRSGTKRPQLTEAGRSILEDARRLLGDLDLMRARVRALNDGLEGKLSIAISSAVPSGIVVDVLHAFRNCYPTVSLNVTVGTLGIVMDAVINGRAAVGFGGSMATGNIQIVSERIGQSAMIPVAAPDHPLGLLGRPITLADVRDETQLVVYDASGLTKGRDFNVFSLQTWRISDNATKHLFIRGGLGWGGLPASLVKDDLANGRLVHLQFPAFDQGQYPIYAIHNDSNPPGPGARWLTSEFRARLSREAEGALRCPLLHDGPVP
ncbi:DNA-binding transcriptional LysR family regulator [Sinorhizobium fredii]|uniref:Transcriptional regulator, LysR family n=1 Tax=Sinorhizobium fredii (strain USDA 257) TaxID=1185652 RepID=I3X3W6_SINF2|nr:LysR family transcriptional regulator [Sinorhizobium fredii]AFL50572.1 transcriptional regulator, LysR family [Sinorhizobium fredii USDA 257]